MLLLFANNILVYFLVNIMSTVDLTFLQKEQTNDEKMNLYCTGSRRTWRWALVRQRDWPRVGERKAQAADIEIKRRLLMEYFLEKQTL